MFRQTSSVGMFSGRMDNWISSCTRMNVDFTFPVFYFCERCDWGIKSFGLTTNVPYVCSFLEESYQDDLAFPDANPLYLLWVDSLNHLTLAFLSDRAFKISCSSWRLYLPIAMHSLNTWLSILLVSASAIWACDGTQRTWIPFCKCSLINLACRWVLNSWHDGGAVLLMRSYSDLQSVVSKAA